MGLGRAVMSVATFVVALLVAIAVPLSQLRTVAVITTCCCPDPSNCHCPDHKADHSTQPSMRACHKSQHESVAPEAPAFTEVALAVTDVAAPVALGASIALPSPLAAPDPARPDAPS